MKKLLALILACAMLLGLSTALAEDPQSPGLVEALVVTEVLDWGETVTALRLEYSEEIYCGAIENSNEHPGKLTYALVNDRDIVDIYVNNSGVKDDVQLYGKYVFLNLSIPTQADMEYRDAIVFNTTSKYRDQISAYYFYQQEEIVTRAGNVIPRIGRTATTGELCIGVDDFETFTYENPEDGTWLNYHLYIPEGHENESLPLVVHYPSGDYSYTDYTGLYRGALFTHPDCTVWASPEAQAQNPCYVVTVGGQADSTWSTVGFEDSAMQKNYVNIIHELTETYPIDTSRIYCISLAGGSTPMWSTILSNPDLFAAQISTAYDYYHTFKDVALAEEKAADILSYMPSWSFAGLTDGSGAGCLGEEDTRLKGERLRDIGYALNERGCKIDVGYGEEGELMWNGLLRGEKAEELAKAQIARAQENGCEHMFTLYIPNTINQTMHWSWNATYSNAAVRNWLFEQVNE